MALQKFTKSILAGKKIQVFNYGKHRRDFTYIDDIVKGVIHVLDEPAKANESWNSSLPDPATSNAPWRIYNIGNNSPIELMDYIQAIENALKIKANKELLPLQPGDVLDTYADITDLVNDFKYKPSTTIDQGVAKFIEWYKDYYGI
jgi:UDP-glucuronate 4-epimerase